MAALYVKVVPLSPSAAPLDVDYARLVSCAFTADASVEALKQAVLEARRSKLRGAAAEDLLVFYRGACEPGEDEEATFIAAPRNHLSAASELRDVIGESPKAFFLVTASLLGAVTLLRSFARHSSLLTPAPIRAFAGGGGGAAAVAAGDRELLGAYSKRPRARLVGGSRVLTPPPRT